ncbi:MAG: hypothetical protein HDR82_09780 [Bacteroides sp.]|nr:hypothetical protein [Bacteroides sp.]
MKIHKDKALHFTACAAVSLLTAIIIAVLTKSSPGAALSGISTGLAIGLGKEYGDSKSPGNKWDWHDLLADTLGAITGAAIGSLAANLT